jgi:hypothetical protein
LRLRLHHHRVHAVCEITLSRRNLLALLQKLEMEGSARTLVSDDCPEGLELVVRAEDDEQHYRSRAVPPGPMHPRTESFLRALGAPAESGQDEADLDNQDVPEGLGRPIPGGFDYRILDQEEVWCDRFGRVHRIREMPIDYLFNVLSFLERHLATSLWFRARGIRFEEDLGEFEDSDPVEVPTAQDRLDSLRAKPLMRALGQAAQAHLCVESSEDADG